MMPRWMVGSSVVLLVMGLIPALPLATAQNDAAGANREATVAFLRDKVMGKPLTHKGVTTIDGGKVEVEFQKRTTFSNLAQTRSGLTFDVLYEVKQVNYDLGADGKRGPKGQKQDRVALVRYELRERASSGRIIGVAQVVSNTSLDSTGSGVSVLLQPFADKLQWREVTIGYEDFFAQGDRRKPGATESRLELSLKEGRLVLVERYQSFDVNPETLERTAVGEPQVMTSEEER